MRNIFKVIKLEPVELSCWLKVNQVLLRAQWDLQLEVYVTSAARRRYLFKLCQTRTFTFKDQSFHCWDQSEKTTFHSSNEHPPLPISTVVELESGTFSLMLLLSSSPMLHPAYIFISTFRNKYIYICGYAKLLEGLQTPNWSCARIIHGVTQVSRWKWKQQNICISCFFFHM